MKGFSGFKSSPTKFKMGKGYDKPVSTKKRAQIGKANKMLDKIRVKDMQITQADLQPKAKQDFIKKQEDFLKKNTVKSKAKKTLSRPLVKNVSKVLRNVSRGFGAAGVALGIYEGAKEVFKGYGEMGKTEQGKKIIKSGRMQPGKI